MALDLKQKVYVKNPHTLQELENESRRVLNEIAEREWVRERERERGVRARERVAEDLSEFSIHRCDYCIKKGGNYLQNMLW